MTIHVIYFPSYGKNMVKIRASGFLIILVLITGGCSLFKKDRVRDINYTKWSPTMLMTKNMSNTVQVVRSEVTNKLSNKC